MSTNTANTPLWAVRLLVAINAPVHNPRNHSVEGTDTRSQELDHEPPAKPLAKRKPRKPGKRPGDDWGPDILSLQDKVLAVRKMVGGDKKRGMERLLRQARNFLNKFVRIYVGDDLDAADLWQTATLAFWTAVQDWDPTRASFVTHARWRLRTALPKLLRGSRMVRGCRDVGLLDEDVAGREDDVERGLLRDEAQREVSTALAKLSPEHQAVLEAILDGVPIKEYSETAGISHRDAKQLLAAAQDAMAIAVRQNRAR